MPEHLRALPIILVLAGAVFAFAKAPACASAFTAADFERRRNLWFAITLVAFLAHNFWLYIVVAAALLLFALPRESNKLALYFCLLFAVPAITKEVPGFGVVDHFFKIHYLRLLALAMLLPAFLSLAARPDSEPIGRSLVDKLLLGYLGLDLVLLVQAETFTNAIRHGVFYAFIDVFLPYYVASRSLKTLAAVREVLMAFVVAAMVLAAIAAFEFGKRWLLYTSVEDALGVWWGGGYYLRRGENLRALASTGQPIVLGYVLAVALGFLLYLKKSIPDRRSWWACLLLLIIGLIAALSRGPWIGAVVIVVLFVALGPSAGQRLVKTALMGAIVVLALMLSPAAQTVIDHLPFVGSIDQKSVAGRERLLEVSIQVIMQNPFFGSINARYSDAMEQLRGGDGLIDIVNSYVRIALRNGLVGLSLFVGVFIAAAAAIFGGMRRVADRTGELYLLGQALLATLLGILLIIYTVSSISVIPIVYWSVAGFGIAYARMVALAEGPQPELRPYRPGAGVKLET